MATKRAWLIGALAASAVLGLTLAGCSSNNNSNSSSSSSSSSGSDSGVTLQYWASNQAATLPDDVKVLTPVLNTFKQETGITVKLNVIDWNSLQTKINTATTSGGVDVVNIGNTWGPTYQAGGAFVNLGESSNASAIGGLSKFSTTALDAGSQPDQTSQPASVPLYGLAYGLYYNKAMFQAAGITAPPSTWEEFVADAQKLTDKSKGVYGVALAGGSYTENVHFAFITAAQNGAKFYNGTTPTFTSPEIVSGIQRYLDLIGKDGVVNPADAQNSTANQALNELATGKAAMMLSQNNADASLIADGMKQGAWGVTALPWPANTPAANQISTFPAGINIAILKSTKNLSAALKFVNYMTSASTQAILDKPYSALPVLKGATPSFTTDTAEAQTFVDAYNNHSAVLPQVATEGDFESAVGKAISTLVADIAQGQTVGSAQITSALQAAQTTVEAAG